MSIKTHAILHFEYLENLNFLIIIINYKNEFNEISFDKNGLKLVDHKQEECNIVFDKITIDPKSAFNVNIKKYKNIYEATFRFKVIEFKKDIETIKNTNNQIESIQNINCLFCNEMLNYDNSNFKLLPMPDNDLEELEDNFWCHKHKHDHNHNDENHSHQNETFTDEIDKFKSKKSILFNNSTILVNKNHIDYNRIKLKSTAIECMKCNYKIGFIKNNLNDYFYLWKSNILINNSMNFDLFSFIKCGRYVIEVKNDDEKRKKKNYLFIHILIDNLIHKHLKLNTRNKSLSFNKKSTKLLFKVYNDPHDSELRNKWLNDINVEYLNISYGYYLKILNILIESTKKLPIGQRMAKNDFLIAII